MSLVVNNDSVNDLWPQAYSMRGTVCLCCLSLSGSPWLTAGSPLSSLHLEVSNYKRQRKWRSQNRTWWVATSCVSWYWPTHSALNLDQICCHVSTWCSLIQPHQGSVYWVNLHWTLNKHKQKHTEVPYFTQSCICTLLQSVNIPVCMLCPRSLQLCSPSPGMQPCRQISQLQVERAPPFSNRGCWKPFRPWTEQTYSVPKLFPAMTLPGTAGGEVAPF